MKKTVAIVKLAPGNSGFFDPLTGLYLTLDNKIGYVYDKDDTTNIRAALKKHTLELTGGVLPPVVSNKVNPVEVKKIKKIEIPKAKSVTPNKREKIEIKEEPKIICRNFESEPEIETEVGAKNSKRKSSNKKKDISTKEE